MLSVAPASIHSTTATLNRSLRRFPRHEQTLFIETKKLQGIPHMRDDFSISSFDRQR
jgi:hypothetical protein